MSMLELNGLWMEAQLVAVATVSSASSAFSKYALAPKGQQ
jgi:hypothetical protein